MTRGLALAALLSAAAPTAEAQGVLDRTPNLDDGWTVPTGVIQFNFLHRFEVSPPPARKVTSFPNFRLATGLPYGFNVDLDYATNSTVFTGIEGLTSRANVSWLRLATGMMSLVRLTGLLG